MHMIKIKNPYDRFIKYFVVPENPNECWLWLGAKNKTNKNKSYIKPVFWDGKKCVNAARFSYRYKFGEKGTSLSTCHKCDNSICVNPDHIFLGTHIDNMTDLYKKNLHLKGEKSGMAKINKEIALDIFISKEPKTILCNKYGVSLGLVDAIKYGYVWNHVTNMQRKKKLKITI